MRRKFIFTMALMIVLIGMLPLTSNIHPIKAESGTRFIQNAHTYGSPKTTVLILLNETIYPEIVDQLTIFEQDLASNGYDTIMSTLSNGLTPPEIKGIIKSYYVESNISGCILIGDVKAAYSEIRTGDYSNSSALKIWISLDAVDMYYMDLDGYWENVTHPDFYAHMPPNVVEVHLYPSCETFYNEYIVYLNETRKWDYSTIENKTEYRAEIWVSRIMGHNLAIPGKNETEIIKKFLEWDHTFRTKQKQIDECVYLLNAIGPGYNDQNMNYSGIFNSIIKKEYVAKSDYLNCLENPNGSELIYLTAHSEPQGHMLYDTSLTVDELASSNKTSVFYILNACSACRWDQYVSSPASPNYLGGIYVFDKNENEKNYGLGAMGFTGVGGFNWLEFFTDYLTANRNGSYAEAYKYWFNENLMHIFGTTNYVYLGDPTIGPKTPKQLVHNLNTGLNYTTIQEAIDASETLNGHVIQVDAGVYFEHVTITKSISLVGEDRDSVIVDGNGTGTVILVRVNDVSIINFTIRNAGRIWEKPWHLDSCIQGSYVVNVRMKNNTFAGAAVCVWFDHSSLVDASDSIIFDATYAGIIGYASYNVTICHNVVYDYGSDGIHLDGGSRYCRIANNTVMNGFDGITLETNPESLSATADNLIDGNYIMNNTLTSIGLWKCGTNTFQRNNMTNNKNSFVVWGFALSNFIQDVDTSNIANNETVYYLTNRTDLIIDPSGYPHLGNLMLVNCTNIVVRDFDLSSNGDGVLLAGSVNCTLTGITIKDNHQPVIYGGFPFIYGGLTFFESSNNTIVQSKISNNSYGICLYHSNWNAFYHNSFVNNSRNLISDFYSPFQNISSGYFSQSVWENGVEGNYWSEYNGLDSDCDGIGDTSYIIDANNQDKYPLMGVFSDFNATEQHHVQTICNSSISDFQFSGTAIRFNVIGENGTTGFCRICIPTALMNGTYTVFVNDTEVSYRLLPCSNETYSYLYFNYTHSTQEVIIIPEFPLFLILPLFMIATLLVVIVYRRKHRCNCIIR